MQLTASILALVNGSRLPESRTSFWRERGTRTSSASPPGRHPPPYRGNSLRFSTSFFRRATGGSVEGVCTLRFFRRASFELKPRRSVHGYRKHICFVSRDPWFFLQALRIPSVFRGKRVSVASSSSSEEPANSANHKLRVSAKCCFTRISILIPDSDSPVDRVSEGRRGF